MLRDPLPEAEFRDIFSKVPRLTVEVVVRSSRGLLLTKREVGPCKDMWHIPGGTVRFGESLIDAVHRVAKDELDAKVIIDDFLGYIEYPSHYENGLDCPVGLAFLVHAKNENIKTLSDKIAWFTSLPDNMHDEQKTFISQRNLVLE